MQKIDIFFANVFIFVKLSYLWKAATELHNLGQKEWRFERNKYTYITLKHTKRLFANVFDIFTI